MNKISTIVVIIAVFITLITSCTPAPELDVENEIPTESIRYTHMEFGNVIDEGKRAVFFVFASEYSVSKMEIVGELLDREGNVIEQFDHAVSFSKPRKDTEMAIRIDKDLIEDIGGVTFTSIRAYTEEKINSESTD